MSDKFDFGKLEKAIEEVAPLEAASIAQRYRNFSDSVALTLMEPEREEETGYDSDEIHRIEGLVEQIMSEGIDLAKKTELVEELKSVLITDDQTVLANSERRTERNARRALETRDRELLLEKESRLNGFAGRLEIPELQKIWDGFSATEKFDLISEIASELPFEQQMRFEQLATLITVLETIKNDRVNSNTWGEWWAQRYDFDEERIRSGTFIDQYVFWLKKEGPAAILRGKSIDDLLSGHDLGKEVRDILGEEAGDYDFIAEIRESEGVFGTISASEAKHDYYNNLVTFLRSRREYAAAQRVIEDILEDQFGSGMQHISKSVNEDLKDKAWEKVHSKATKEQRKKWREKLRKEGVKEGEVDDAIDKYMQFLVEMQHDRLRKDYAAEHYITSVEGNGKALWDQYVDMLDPKGEVWNMADANQDFILDELVVNAPLIIISGGTAAVGRGVLSAVGRSLLAKVGLAGRFASLGSRLASGGKFAQTTLKVGNLTGAAAGLVVEGFLFEMTYMGLQGEWLLDQPDWVKKTLWTAASLGAFKKAGQWGKSGAEGFNKYVTANLFPKIADKNFVKICERLLIQGHAEVAAMLLINMAQHTASGQFDEFLDTWGLQVFRSYVAVGSLHVAGGVIKTAAGRMVGLRGPKGGPKGYEKGERDASRVVEKEGTPEKPRRDVVEAVELAVESGRSERFYVGELALGRRVVDILQKAGFELEVNKHGELVARRGEQMIMLKEGGELAKEVIRVKHEAEKRIAEIEFAFETSNPGRLMRAYQGLTRLSARFSPMLFAVVMGCSKAQQEAFKHGGERVLGTGADVVSALIYAVAGSGMGLGAWGLWGYAKAGIAKKQTGNAKTDSAKAVVEASKVKGEVDKGDAHDAAKMETAKDGLNKLGDSLLKLQAELATSEARALLPFVTGFNLKLTEFRTEVSKDAPDTAVLNRLLGELNAEMAKVSATIPHITTRGGKQFAMSAILLIVSATGLLSWFLRGSSDEGEDDSPDGYNPGGNSVTPGGTPIYTPPSDPENSPGSDGADPVAPNSGGGGEEKNAGGKKDGGSAKEEDGKEEGEKEDKDESDEDTEGWENVPVPR